MRRRRSLAALAALAVIGSAATAHAQAPHRDMIAAANPLAAEAGREILRRGGSAVDAAIAAQLVLNLVEPESSGLGGGAIMVLWSASERRVTSFDGRETAPLAAKPDRFLDAQGAPLNYFDALVGGRSVGVPGLLRMLDLAHRRYGKLPWASLFEPALRLAENGYPMSQKLHDELARDRIFGKTVTPPDLFFAADGSVKPVGTVLTNPALAAVFKTVAAGGADTFYGGAIAADIVATVDHAAVNPGDMSLADIAAYAAKERAPVCGAFRAYFLCGMGPPSSGGVAVLEILGLLQHFDLFRQINTAGAWNVFAQASRLA
jgi:gamma-glutamyltranspeptidase/glutathione hydrolase